MKALVDTNVLVYRFDPRDPTKQSIAHDVLRAGIASGSLCIAHQAIIEFVQAVTRPVTRAGSSLLSREEALREAEELLVQFEVLYPTEAILRTAIRGAAAYKLGWFDAHMWAYAEVHGLHEILSEDFSDGQMIGSVPIRNPFNIALHQPRARYAGRSLPTMKIATWNVNGIRARQAQFCEWLARDQPDVVCLQELKAEPAQIPAACQLEDYHVYWHGMRGYSGVSLHLRKAAFPNPPAFSHPAFDFESRIVQAQVGDLILASVYCPNGGKDYEAKLRFFEDLIVWTKQVHDSGRQLVLSGDINIAREEIDVHPKERKPDVIGQRPEERDIFRRLLGDHLVDVGRKLDPDNPNVFSWWPPWRQMRQRNIGWRIDYILASPSIAERATSCAVLADFGTSDHAPVMMTTA